VQLWISVQLWIVNFSKKKLDTSKYDFL
jgi:hypothetical protein